MTGSPRSVSVLGALVLLSALGTVSCGSSGGPSQGTSTAPQLTVPDTFGSRAGHYGAISATATRLVGLGGMTPRDDGADEVRFGGEIVDLQSGSTSQIDAPTVDGRPVDVLAAAADDTQVITIGRVCDDVAHDGSCEPATISASILDPESKVWTASPLPPSVSDQRLASVPLLQVNGAGSFVAVVNIESAGDEQTQVLTFTDGQWAPNTDLKLGSSLRTACATEQSLFVLHASSQDPSDQGDGPTGTAVNFSMEEVNLATGKATKVDLPPLAQTFGGAGVSLGCGPGSPTVASGAPGAEAAVFSFDNGQWQDVPGALSGSDAVAGSVMSGPRGVLVGGYSAMPDKTKRFSYAAINEAGELSQLDPGLIIDANAIWKGHSGTALYIVSGDDGGPGTGNGHVEVKSQDVF